MSLWRYLSLDYYLGSFGYIKAGQLDAVADEPTTDDDIERIDMTFVEDVRKTVRWFGANGTDVPAIVNADRAGVIGSKLNIQSRLENAPDTNRQIEKYIKKWSRIGNCDVTGRWHFNAALRSMVEATDKDGGFLVRHHINKNWDIPYRFELIEVGMIDTKRHDPKKNLLNGLQRDRYGRVSHIWLFKDQERNSLDSRQVSTDDITYFSPVWVSLSQYTAISKLATTLPSINKLEQYSDAELKSAITKAKNGRVWRTTLYDDLMKIIREERDSTSRKAQLETVMQRISKAGVKPEGFTPIPLADDIVKLDEPSASVYTNLTRNTKQAISAASGMSAQIVYQDSSDSNYGSIKAIMAFASEEWSIRFDDLENQVIDPIMRRVIQAGVDRGKIDAPDFYDDPDEYIKLDYMRVSEIDIDPKKTADANNIRLNETRDISLREICRKRGRDVEDVIREQEEEALMRERIRSELTSEGGE